MGDTLLSNVGGKIADQFIVQLYVPAYVFWAGGAALYLRAHWTWLKPVVTTLPESNLVGLAAAWLLLVASSAAIGQRFEPGVIRLLEGYHWPKWLIARPSQFEGLTGAKPFRISEGYPRVFTTENGGRRPILAGSGRP